MGRPQSLSRLNSGELVCASSLLAVGAFVVIYGLRYPLLSDGVVGPGLMPMVSGLALAAVSLFLIVKTLRSGLAAATPAAVTPPATEKPGEALSLGDFAEDDGAAAGKPTTVVGILGLLVLAAAFAPTFGLIPMMGVLVFVCVLVFERLGLLTASLMAAGSMGVGWLVFGKLFEVPMPYGSFWQAIGW